MMNNIELSGTEKEVKNLTFVVYALYAIAWLNGISAMIAIVINYIK